MESVINLIARYESLKAGEFLTIEGPLKLDFIRKHFYSPRSPFLFCAEDSTKPPYPKPYISFPLTSRSEFLDLFEFLRSKGEITGAYTLSLPTTPNFAPKNNPSS
jgi:hypothetical protein